MSLNISKKILLVLFFLSGACGLIYEVLWIRMMAILFGGTTLATSTVLAVFMGGLALGGYLAGRAAEKIKPVLFAFGILQCGIGVWGFLTPLLFKGLMYTYPVLYQWLCSNAIAIGGLRFIISFAILFIPTLLMGGTLPFLTKFYADSPDKQDKDIAVLYGVNTLGAVLGVLASGFILIWYLGVSKTIFLTAGMNIIIGMIVFLIYACGRSYAGGKRLAFESKSTALEKTDRFFYARMMILWLSLSSGCASFIYQVAFSRALTLFFGSSVYAVAAVIASFILGLALGSFFAPRFLVNKEKAHLFSLSQLRIAFGAALFLALYLKLPAGLVWFYSFLHNQFWLFQCAQLILVFLAILYPTFWMGVSFPVAAGIYAQGRSQAGRDIGALLAFNTLGCLCGSLLAGFFLVPWLGIQQSIILAMAINLGTGWMMLSASLTPHKWSQPIFGTIVIAGILLVRPAWDKEVLTSGYYARLFAKTACLKSDFAQRQGGSLQGYAQMRQEPVGASPGIGGGPLPRFFADQPQIIYYKEGVNSTIAVLRQGKNRTLKINGKADASTFEVDLRTQFLLGYIPLLLHKDPESILVVGLGSGCTAGTFLTHPQVKSIDCIEIEPAVVRACRYFAPENNFFFQDPRVKIIIDDARSFTLTASQKYDVISCEPSNLYMGGVSTLFTYEHFLACRNALNKNGIICQWVHAYQLSRQDLGIIFNTFKAVFQHVLLFSNSDDLILIGSERSLQERLNRVKDMILVPAAQLQLEVVGLAGPEDIAGFRGYKGIDMDALAQGLPLNSDDRPILEFSVPRSQYTICRQ